MEDTESLYFLRRKVAEALAELDKPFNYKSLPPGGRIGIHVGELKDAPRLSPELDELRRKDYLRGIADLDERIARAEKEWSETPKLTLKPRSK